MRRNPAGPTIISAAPQRPLLDGARALWGTMSHFDAVSLALPAGEFHLMEQAGRLLGPQVAGAVRHAAGQARVAAATLGQDRWGE